MNVSGFWMVVGIVTGIILLSALALAKSRQSVYDQLQGYTFVQDSSHRQALEGLASQVADQELQKYKVDRRLLSAAISVLRQTSREKEYRDKVESAAATILTDECQRKEPRPARLRVGYDLLAMVDSSRVDVEARRIVGVATFPSSRVNQLHDLTQRIHDHLGETAADRTLSELAVAYVDNVKPAWKDWSWLTSKENVLEDAVAEARDAAIRHFEMQLANFSSTSPDAAKAERLRRTYEWLNVLGATDRLEQATRSRYALAVRRASLPASGWAVALLVAIFLLGGLGFAIRRVMQGPDPIDPMAETLENVEPIDLDTDAVTLDGTGQRKSITGTGTGTGTGSDTVA